MILSSVLKNISLKDKRGSLSCNITGITAHHSRVQDGFLFVAQKGMKKDGHDFIEEAISRGASAILCEKKIYTEGKATILVTANTQNALTTALSNFYPHAYSLSQTCAVTGTKGKTTITHLLHHIAKAAGFNSGIIGTIGSCFGDTQQFTDLTTPAPEYFAKTLSQMADNNVTHLFFEASSIGIKQKRFSPLPIKVAVFSNLHEEHLDLHHSMEEYYLAKKELFTNSLNDNPLSSRYAVINIDTAWGKRLFSELEGIHKIAVSLTSDTGVPDQIHPDVKLLQYTHSLAGMYAVYDTPAGVISVQSSLIGKLNLENIALAIAAAWCFGFSSSSIRRGIKNLSSLSGRLQKLVHPNGAHIFIDYAHTADSLEKAILSLRDYQPTRLITIFGCGGNRDRSKRKLMGKASELSDTVILTNDNPRDEIPEQIIADIEQGMQFQKTSLIECLHPDAKKCYSVELDRKLAITSAIQSMSPNDFLLIAGKGHENTMTIRDTVLSFSDYETVKALLG